VLQVLVQAVLVGLVPAVPAEWPERRIQADYPAEVAAEVAVRAVMAVREVKPPILLALWAAVAEPQDMQSGIFQKLLPGQTADR
jgi:hypothetical protein